MGVIEDILGMSKKDAPPSSQDAGQGGSQSPFVKQEPEAVAPSQEKMTGIVQSPPIKQGVETGKAFKEAYSKGDSFYGALSKTFAPKVGLDEKKVQSRKNLAGLADFAMGLNDIITSSIGGNVVARNSSVQGDFDNKLMNYRRYLDNQNRHYDMLAYQAKMRDLQDKIRRGERLEDILHRSNRENVQDQRFQDEKAWRKKQSDENNRRWNLSFDRQDKQLKKQNENSDRQFALQKERLSSSERLGAMRYLYQTLKNANKGGNEPVDFITNDGTYTLPKKSAKAIIPQLYSIMQKEAKDMGQDEADLIDIKMTFGEGGDQASKMEAIVRANLNRYPNAEAFLKEYQSQSGKESDNTQSQNSRESKWNHKIMK